MPEKPPEGQQGSIGQYYIMEKVAQGGMAEIYRGLAYDVHGISQREVCIKKILPHLSADKEFIGSLIDEAKLAVKLVHGNIAQTFDLGKVGDDYYMVMEYVEGATLSQINKRCLARSELIPVPLLVYFISEVAQGLDYMHRRTDENGVPLHIVHRDISPQNIMVSFSGTVKLIDFGIAKPAFKASGTDSGLLKGKFAYMSPEQALGEEVDHRSDIFSLGVMLHEFLTGKRLFKAADSRETIRNVRRALVEPVVNTRPDVPDELDRITMKALTKDRRHRYPYASEMREDLLRFLFKHYPQFGPSEASSFVQELFKNEMDRKKSLEADSKTPALIIDRTNSALAGDEQFEVTGAARAPASMKEFMLDEESHPPPPDDEERAGTDEEEETSEREPGRGIPPPPERRPAKRSRAGRTALVIAGLALISFVGLRAYLHLTGRAPLAVDPSSPAGMIVVTDPADAALSIDGREVGRGSPITLEDLEPGREIAITVSREGFVSATDRVTLKPGELRRVKIGLVRASPPLAEIEINSTPPGATVFLDDLETPHRTPVTLKGLDARKEHSLGLFLPGYSFWSKKISLKEGQSRSYYVELSKNFGSVVIDSHPQGALVMLDGAPVGTTPMTREDLDPEKTYEIEIWHEGFAPEKIEFKPAPGAKRQVMTRLTPLPKGAPAPVPEGPAEIIER